MARYQNIYCICYTTLRHAAIHYNMPHHTIIPPICTPTQDDAVEGNLFLPTNEALSSALSTLNVDLTAPLSEDQTFQLYLLILYHVTKEPGFLSQQIQLPTKFIPVQGVPYTECNVFGETELGVTPTDDGLTVEPLQNSTQIAPPIKILSEHELCSGLNVHIIDGVLSPCADFTSESDLAPAPTGTTDRNVAFAPAGTRSIAPISSLGPSEGPLGASVCNVVEFLSSLGCELFASMLSESGLVLEVLDARNGRTLVAPNDEAV